MNTKRAPFVLRPLLYTSILLVGLASCVSPQKLVERGDYEQAIHKSIDKLAGKKNKKTKYVQALEEAFAKATERDLKAAERLKAEERPENWEQIATIYQRIDRRQAMIQPLLPLVDKEGIKAEFRFVRVDDLQKEAEDKTVSYLYDQALDQLELAQKGNKAAARKAYDNLDKIGRYVTNYRERQALMKKAKDLGTIRVLLAIENHAPVILPGEFENAITSLGVRDLNSNWTQYYSKPVADVELDYKVVMRITNIQMSPSLVNEREYEDVKEIEDGFDYVLDKNGNVMKDTSGNDIKVPRKVLIRARVFETYQHKVASVSGRLDFFDARTRELLNSQPLAADAVFENYAATFRGDKRALSDESRRHIGNTPAPFPSDASLLLTAAERLKPVIKDQISRSRILL